MNEKRAMTSSQLLRHISLLVHRYVGLVMATFLIVAGLTGSMMAFYPQLDAMLNPELFAVSRPSDGRPPLDPFVLREKLLAQFPAEVRRETHGVLLEIDPNIATNYAIDGKEVFVDPYTAEIKGSRTFGSLLEGRKSILTFFYHLHFTLGLGDVGIFLFGVVAVLWTVDCFVGAYLTFPLPAKGKGAKGRKPWVVRWWPAWLLKTSKLFSLIFSWHRASGLWIWMMLLVFAWSAVALNMGDVYEPVMEAIFGKPHQDEPLALPTPRESPKLSLREAYERGKVLMAAEGRERGFEVYKERSLYYDPEHGSYSYSVESSLDISERLADTSISFDGDTGERLSFLAATGEHTGSTVSAWLIALHFGSVRVGGLAYRWFVCVLGVLVALLSISGVWIWWKKRSGRVRKPVGKPVTATVSG